jgi:hypothetical protein
MTWPLGFFVRARSVASGDAGIVGQARDNESGGKDEGLSRLEELSFYFSEA